MVVAILPGMASIPELRAEQPPDIRATIDRGLVFVVKDAQAWKVEHNCVSCHHDGLVA
jgi:hypothetical protein